MTISLEIIMPESLEVTGELAMQMIEDAARIIEGHGAKLSTIEFYRE